MLTLLKKDWRLNRAPVIGSLFVLFVPYLLWITGEIYNRVTDGPRPWPLVADDLFEVSIVELFLFAIMAGVFGANAFAGERSDRTFDFLSMLPTPRVNILASKWFVALVCITVPWLMNAAVAWNFAREPYHGRQFVFFALLTTLWLFGIAWLASTILKSPAISVGIAIGLTLAEILWIFVQDRLKLYGPEYFQIAEIFLMFATGPICFIAGSIYWLRRVEP